MGERGKERVNSELGRQDTTYLDKCWYDSIQCLGDDLEAILVILSQHMGSHEREDGHNIVEHTTLRREGREVEGGEGRRGRRG